MKYEITAPDYLPKTRMLKQREDGRPVYNLEEGYLVTINRVPFLCPLNVHFDYASVPRGLWNLFPPADPDYAVASLVHDLLYAGQILPRRICDEIFRDAILSWKRGPMFMAVRMGGAGPYARGAKRLLVKRHRVRELIYGPQIDQVASPLFKTFDDFGGYYERNS